MAANVLSRSQRLTLEALTDTLVPAGGLVPPGGLEVGAPGQLERFLAGCAPGTRRTVRLMITLFNLAPVASRHARTFRRMSPASRAAFVHEVEAGRQRQRREALVALRALLLMMYCSDDRVRPLIGYDGTPRRSPVTPPGARVVETVDQDAPLDAAVDFVVVGSGAGGAVCAHELARAGHSVLVLEEGRRFEQSDFQGPLPDRLRTIYRGNGLTFTLGNPVISLPMGRGVGGTTLINSGTCFRTPDWVMEQWSADSGIRFDPDEFGPYFDEVERVLNVHPVPPETMGANGEVMARGLSELGYSGGPIRRNSLGCHGHGVCAFGCPINAKLGMHVSFLPLARDHGATVMTNCRVDGIELTHGRATGVTGWVLDPATGARRHRLRVRARTVVLAAGAVHTPYLLLGNRLANRSGQVGRNLRIHPGNGVLAEFDEDLVAWRGVMQNYYVDERIRDGILLEATFPPPGVGYSAGGLPHTGIRSKDMMGRFRNTAALGSIISDSGSGRVRRGPSGPLMQYSLDPRDTQKVLEGIGLAAEIYLAAGATAVYPMLPGLESIKTPAEARAVATGRWRASDLKLSAYHPMGTCRMGRDPRQSVVDENGMSHDLPGLCIADASVLPGSTHVNPQISIMALAARIGRRLAEAS
ncbi:MAG: GMC family oxidoreductase N-terminal domain-containing protein [Candidatus Dormibacteria bacterium]